jgi:Ca2+-binding RTX toxin-like protein
MIDVSYVINLSYLTAYEGINISGGGYLGRYGFSVSDVGDVNGDGIDDVIVGAVGYGLAYVIYGAAGSTRVDVNLNDLSPDLGFRINRVSFFDNLGGGVSAAGDVNDDGIDDIIVGAWLGDAGGRDAGAGYVIYGAADNIRTRLELSDLSPVDGFLIQGDDLEDKAGRSISAAGDVNGDGIDDIIIGAENGDDGGFRAGEAYVVYGTADSTRAHVDLTDLSPDDGFVIQGDEKGDWAGYSVSAAGDVNGDGIDDVIVGAFRGDDGGASAGEAYVIYGTADSTRARVDLSDLSANDGFVIQGDRPHNNAGYSVSVAGDVNGDGIDDVIIGARKGGGGPYGPGEAYVIYGAAGSARVRVDLTDLSANDGFVIQGDKSFDNAGFSVSAAGDVNGDGIDDVIVGAPYGDDGGPAAGEAYVIYGIDEITRERVYLTDLSPNDGFIIQGDGSFGQAGFSVSAAGDVNDDGIDDVIVGAPRANPGSNGGAAYVVYGFTSLIGSPQNDTLYGDADDNVINGVAGADLMVGNAGSDRFIVDDLGDQVVESRNWAGTDTVISSVDFSMGPQHIEDLHLTGSAVTGIGNGLMNTLIGSTQDNILDGGRNADILIGADGNDTYFVQDTGDVVIEERNEGTNDVVKSRVSYTLADNLEQLHLLTRNNIDGTGNELRNKLVGNMSDNVLNGGGARDILQGQGGADTFVFDTYAVALETDRIVDFTTGEDKIALDFGLGAAGVLSEDAFLLANGSNASADRALYGDEDRVIYDATSGKLWIDTDGSGAEKTWLIATLLNRADLTADDFILL